MPTYKNFQLPFETRICDVGRDIIVVFHIMLDIFRDYHTNSFLYGLECQKVLFKIFLVRTILNHVYNKILKFVHFAFSKLASLYIKNKQH